MHNGALNPMMYAERGINQRNAAVIIALLCSKLPISYRNNLGQSALKMRESIRLGVCITTECYVGGVLS